MFLKKILVKCYFLLLHILQTVFGVFITKKQFVSTKKKAFLIGTPEHDNLGDHAIALAEIQFIKRYFPDYEIVEISVEGWRKYKYNLLKKCKKEDIFFLTGGGNMGDIYLLDEQLRRYIITHFTENRVVIFPQTVYFSSDNHGQKELLKTKKVYNLHKNLLICAREEKSYSLMKEYFINNQVFLCPDMVFGLEIDVEKEHNPQKAGVCLREDCESKMNDEQREEIISTISEKFSVERFNTCLSHGILPHEREKYLRDILYSVSQNAFVVTDRLHAVIFSVITGTPCVAFSGTSHKISATKKWLNGENSLLILEDIEQLKKITMSGDLFKNKPCDTKWANQYYEEMAKLIKEGLCE